jgi:hypothetical protein
MKIWKETQYWYHTGMKILKQIQSQYQAVPMNFFKEIQYQYQAGMNFLKVQ